MQVKSHYNLGFPLIMWTIRLKYLGFLGHAMMLNMPRHSTWNKGNSIWKLSNTNEVYNDLCTGLKPDVF